MKKYLWLLLVPLFFVGVQTHDYCRFDATETLNEINKARADAGVGRLVMGESVTRLSRDRVLALNGRADHHEGFVAMTNSGAYEGTAFGEAMTLDRWCPRAELMVGSWLRSTTGHRELLLNEQFKYVGISYRLGIAIANLSF
jgi:uncharacterized protein YkwD